MGIFDRLSTLIRSNINDLISRAELQQVRHELADLAERMDFAERLLAQQREAGRLPGT